MPTGGNFVSCCCGPQAEVCENKTTALATTPLCLADGTPIAVVLTRDCDGNVTQDGWLDLTTGEYTEGAPPADASPCAGGLGESPGDVSPGQPIPPRPEYELARWCDLDEAGEVIAPVLVEYKYGPTGALEDVRTLTPDGQPYTVQGQLGVCNTLPEESPSEESPGTPCVHCQTIPMCDTTVEDVSPGEGTEIPWSVVSVDPDPESEPGYGYLFTLSPDDDPSQRAVVRVTSGKQANTVCPPQNPGDIVFNNTNDLRFELDPVAQTASYLRVDLLDFDTFEPVQIHSDSPEPTRLGGTATWDPEHTRIVPTTSNGTGEMYWDNPPTSFGYRIWNTGGGNSCSQLSFAMVTIDPPVPPPGSEVSTSFLRSICRDCDGSVISTTDTELDGTTPYTVQGRATVCGNTAPAPVDPESPGSPGGQADIVDCEDGGRALLVKLCDTGPAEESPGEPEPCRDTHQHILCDEQTLEPITVFDPANRPGSDGWEVVAFTGASDGFGPEAPMPYPAPHPADRPAYMGARDDLNAGPNQVPSWTGYDTAPIRWVLRKRFDAPQDGVAVVDAINFRGDGGARVRLNGTDAGVYGQWNEPAPSGTARIPVYAGVNVVEIEVRDVGGQNWIAGRLDITLTSSTQFLKTQVVDCETGEIISSRNTTLDGEPYTPTGTVTQCTPTGGGGADCCDNPALAECEDGPALRVMLCESGSPAEESPAEPECTDEVSIAILCDVPPVESSSGDATVTDTTPPPITAATVPLPGGAQPLWDGGAFVIPADPDDSATGANEVYRSMAATVQAARPACDNGTATVTVSVRITNDGPADAAANTGTLRLWGAGGKVLVADRARMDFPAGASQVLTVSAEVPAEDLAAGNILTSLSLETWQAGGGKSWTVDEFTTTYAYDTEGCETRFVRRYVTDCVTGEVTVEDTTLDGEPYTPTGAVAACDQVAEACCPTKTGDEIRSVEPVELCDVLEDGTIVRFVRHYAYNDQGEVIGFTDTDLDGGSYAPAGEVGSCDPELSVCGNDEQTVGGTIGPDGDGSVTDTDPMQFVGTATSGNVGSEPVPGGGAALWSGGALTIPPDTGPGPSPTDGQHYRLVAATLQVDRPVCDDGYVDVTASVRVNNDGPNPGGGTTGSWRLVNTRTGAAIATARPVNDTPVDSPQVLTVTARVSSADLAAGNIAVLLALETWHNDAKGWTADQFQTNYQYLTEGCQTPAEPVMSVKLCSPVMDGAQSRRHLVLRHRCDDTDSDGVADTGYVEIWGIDANGFEAPVLTGTYEADDMSRPYAPVNPVPCPPGAALDPTGEGGVVFM